MFVKPAPFFKVENLKYHLHFISFIRNRHNLKSIMQIKFMSHWTSFFEKQGMAKQVLIDYSCGNNAVKNTFHRQKLKVHTNTCLCLLLPKITRMYNSESEFSMSTTLFRVSSWKCLYKPADRKQNM